MTRCPYCGGRCVDFYLRTEVTDFVTQIDGQTAKFLMIFSECVEDSLPHCVDCGARQMGPEVMINPDFTAEELATGWYRGSYTLEETFR